MGTRAEIILDTRRETKKGYPIKIRVYNNGIKYLPLNEYSASAHWGKNGLLKSHPDYKRLKKKLLDREITLIEEVEHCRENDFNLKQSFDYIKTGQKEKESRIEQLKRELKLLEAESQAMLFEFWDEFIIEREKRKKSIKAFVETKKQMMDFTLMDDMPINDVTYEFLNEFATYKLSGGCGHGGLSFYLRTFRTVYLAAQKRESLNIKSTNPFKGLIDETVSKDPVQMSKSEMNKWKQWTPHPSTTKTAREKYLEEGIFGCSSFTLEDMIYRYCQIGMESKFEGW